MKRRFHCKWPLAALWWLKEPMSNQYSLWDILFMTLIAKFAGRMVIWKSLVYTDVYYNCKTKKDVFNYHGLDPWTWARKWRWWEVKELWEVWSLERAEVDGGVDPKSPCSPWTSTTNQRPTFGRCGRSERSANQSTPKKTSLAWWLLGISICSRRWWVYLVKSFEVARGRYQSLFRDWLETC